MEPRFARIPEQLLRSRLFDRLTVLLFSVRLLHPDNVPQLRATTHVDKQQGCKRNETTACFFTVTPTRRRAAYVPQLNHAQIHSSQL